MYRYARPRFLRSFSFVVWASSAAWLESFQVVDATIDHMIKLIIFDWDDVFTQNSIKGYYKCYHEALKGVGITLSPDEEDKRIKAKWGSGHKAQLEYLLKEHPELVTEAVEIYQENFFGDTFVDCLTVIPGAQGFLKRLAQNYILTIATGAHPKFIKDRLFPKFHIPDVFSQVLTIYDIDDLAHAKPHPYMANKILEAQNVKPEHAVLVGDAASDMQMAWNAGVEPIAVLTGHLNRQEAKKLGVKHIIENVILLEPELKKLTV
jgi:HAD superfamily hydrolase (TIGR01509 family)